MYFVFCILSPTSFLRFSAINSIPSSVIFEQPDKERMVRLGRECTGQVFIIMKIRRRRRMRRRGRKRRRRMRRRGIKKEEEEEDMSPILTSPWLVTSQQLWSLRTLMVPVCFGEKYESAESVTWYA